MACLFGHKWVRCKCEKCGKIRDREHDFYPGNRKCLLVCSRCGTEKEEHSEFINGYCKDCGKRSNTPISLKELTKEEIAEVSPVLRGYSELVGTHSQSTRLSMAYTKNVFADCKKDLMQSVEAQKCLNHIYYPAMALKEAKLTLVLIQYASKKLNNALAGAKSVKSLPGAAQTLTEQEKVPVSNPNKELFMTGMSMNPYTIPDAFRGTIALLNSAAQKIECAIGAYRDEMMKHGDTDEGDAVVSL